MQPSSLRQKLAFALFCLLAPFPLLAQSELGNITGVVPTRAAPSVPAQRSGSWRSRRTQPELLLPGRGASTTSRSRPFAYNETED